MSETLRRRLASVVLENIVAFAATPNDFGRSQIISHTINTGDARFFKHRLQAINFAKRKLLKHLIERLLVICPIFVANFGVCPYALRIVLADENETLRMCVDYRDLNAQTKQDSFLLPRID